MTTGQSNSKWNCLLPVVENQKDNNRVFKKIQMLVVLMLSLHSERGLLVVGEKGSQRSGSGRRSGRFPSWGTWENRRFSEKWGEGWVEVAVNVVSSRKSFGGRCVVITGEEGCRISA